MSATSSSERVGIELTGRSGPDLVDRAAADECLAALERHGVVVYRDAHISDDDLVAFSGLLGEVVKNLTGEHRLREIATITSDPTKTNPVMATYRQGNFFWHIDGMTDKLPQKATLLAAQDVDPTGGDTEFASTYAAYDSLPPERKAEIDDLQVVHSFAAAQRLFQTDVTEEQRAAWDRIPSRLVPLVWKRRDGRRSLLIGATAGEIVGMAADEGRRLLDELLAWSTRPELVLRHRWRRGDLVVWDNTGMLHRALPFEAISQRLLHRTTLVGDEPVS